MNEAAEGASDDNHDLMSWWPFEWWGGDEESHDQAQAQALDTSLHIVGDDRDCKLSSLERLTKARAAAAAVLMTTRRPPRPKPEIKPANQANKRNKKRRKHKQQELKPVLSEQQRANWFGVPRLNPEILQPGTQEPHTAESGNVRMAREHEELQTELQPVTDTSADDAPEPGAQMFIMAGCTSTHGNVLASLLLPVMAALCLV